MDKSLKTIFLISIFVFAIVAVGVVGYTLIPKSNSGAYNSTSYSNTTTSNTGSSSSTGSTTNSAGSSSSNSNACIITIDGQQYDVSQFRYMHPGGDVFECGTDMSSIFHSAHNNYTLQQMEQYKVN